MVIKNWREVTPRIVHDCGIDYRLLSGQAFANPEIPNCCMKGMYYIAHAMLQPGMAYEAHAHGDHEEVYYIISGKGEITIDGTVYPYRDGDAIYIEPGATHSIANTSDEFVIFLAVGTQG